jgi:hypothetical protein
VYLELFGPEDETRGDTFLRFAQESDEAYLQSTILYGLVQRHAVEAAFDLIEGWAKPLRHTAFDEIRTTEIAASELLAPASSLVGLLLRWGYHRGTMRPVHNLDEADEVWSTIVLGTRTDEETVLDDDTMINAMIEEFLRAHQIALEHYLVHETSADHVSTWQTVLAGFSFALYVVMMDWWLVGIKTAERVEVMKEMESSFERPT